ncbi:hypothetical protein [Actinokineospora pegani]|uniref:hypothetical protein n=1 Tax=Actinokineospora pegani TaxID=2654637 RepID=UPI0012EA88C9|nr:hypothetical protein [Actinokineospora pegani]
MFWTRTGLLLAVLIVVSSLASWLADQVGPGTPKTLLSALGTGALVSAVVGFGQTLITASASQRAMVTPLVEESRKALRELSDEYRSLNSEFFPTHVFEATTEPDPAFNALMMRDLGATRQFLFRGFSGRYAAVRLLLAHAEWEVRAVVADPRGRSAVTGRARHLLRHKGADSDYEVEYQRVQEHLHEDVKTGLVGLYLARGRCTSIEVTAVIDPPLDRLELFDDSVWVTLYSSVAGAPALYPRSLRFSEGSFLYDMQRAEFARLRAADAAQFTITPETTRDEFLAHFTEITGEAPSDQRFRELSERFHAFRRDFAAKAELGG